MNKTFGLAAMSAMLLTLAACGGSSDGNGTDTAAPPPRSMGIIRISVTGLDTPNPTATAENVGQPGSSSLSGPQAHALSTLPCFLQIKPAAVNSGTFNTGSQQYASFTFQVRNAQGVSGNGCTTGTANGAMTNLTLVGLVEPGIGINNTPYTSLQKFDGSNELPAVALTLLPTHGMQFDALADKAVVAPGQESLQVFSESQIAGIAIDPEDAPGSYLLPYGFVVRNVDPTKGRTLQANPPAGEYDGQFTFAVRLPTPGTKANAVYSFQYDLQVLVDSQTRVTESAEEQNALGDGAANLRVANLFSNDLAVFGGSHTAATNSGDPVCTVRSAGTAASPTAYLVNNTGVTVASAPYNLQNISTVPTLNAGFCQLMQQVPSGNFNQFVVSGSQSGRRSATGATGTYNGGGTQVLSFQPDSAHPFFPGEQVAFTLTNALSVAGSGAHPAPFAGSFTVASTGIPTMPFTPRGLVVPTGTAPFGVAAGDFNGDGIPDIAVANSGDNTVGVFFGHADGTYAAGTTVGVGSSPTGLAVADFNGDGLQDIVVTNSSNSGGSGSTVNILLSNGVGGFGVVGFLVSAANGPYAVAVADVNGDGVPDIVTANFNSNNITVILVRDIFGGLGAISLNSYNVGLSPRSLAIGDWNGDGKPDIAVVNQGSNSVSVLLNNGSGGMNAATSVAVGSFPVSIVAGDFSHDGHPDLAVANDSSSTISVLKNNGSGVFSVADTLSGLGSGLYGLAAADFNQDGYADIAVTSTSGASNQLTILKNAQAGLNNLATDFTATSPLAAGGLPLALAVARLDNDIYPDLLMTNSTDKTVYVLHNIRAGSFGDIEKVGAAPAGVVTGDFNGDGALDFAVANNGAAGAGNTLSILMSKGPGSFQAVLPGYVPSTVTVGHGPQGLATGDFNADGRLDLLVANTTDNTVSLAFNNGAGVFSCCTNFTTGTAPFGVAVGDFNNDGKPDFAVSNSGDSTVSVFVSSGGTYVQAAGSPLAVGQNPQGMVVSDFNADGKLDLAVSNYTGGAVNIFLGNGSGGFAQASGSPIATSVGGAIVVGDFNGDGTPDLVISEGIGNTCGYFARLLLGQGDGTFKEAPKSPFNLIGAFGSGSLVCSRTLIAGDFNGDGKLDLADAGFTLYIELLGDGTGAFKGATTNAQALGGTAGGITAGDFFGATGNHAPGLAITDGDHGVLQLLEQY